MKKFDFGLDAPSGDMARDLTEGKRVHLRMGQNTRVEEGIEEARTIRFVCSTEGVKRDGNRVRNDGWDLKSFEKNPVMLWAHDYAQPPLGSWSDWKVEKEDGELALVMTAKFADYDFADTIYRLYLDGHMRAVSIGWTPLEYEEIEDEDGRRIGFDFVKNELLECSAVPIPSDPDALMRAVSRGILNAENLESIARASRIGDISRGEAYVLDHRETRQEEEEVAIKLNDKAIDWADRAIDKGDYESSEEWEFTEDDARYLLEGGGGEDWDGYAYHFLGRNEDHTFDSHEGWVYPVAKRREDGVIALYASALVVAQTEAAEAGYSDISEAAENLLHKLSLRDEEQDDEEEPESEEVEVEVEEEDVVVDVDGEVVERGAPLDLHLAYDGLSAHLHGAALPLKELWESIKAYDKDEDGSSRRVEDDAMRVVNLLEAALDICSAIVEQVGGSDEGGDEGGEVSEEEVSVEVEEAAAVAALVRWADSTKVAEQGETSSTETQEILSGIARALGAECDDEEELGDVPDAQGLSRMLRSLVGEEEDGTLVRVGKKVSKNRASKIGEATRCVMRAAEILDALLEDIGESELLTPEEVGPDVEDAEGDEDERKAEATHERDASGESLLDESLEARIERLASPTEDSSEKHRKVSAALEDLAKRLGIDLDSSYADAIL